MLQPGMGRGTAGVWGVGGGWGDRGGGEERGKRRCNRLSEEKTEKRPRIRPEDGLLVTKRNETKIYSPRKQQRTATYGFSGLAPTTSRNADTDVDADKRAKQYRRGLPLCTKPTPTGKVRWKRRAFSCIIPYYTISYLPSYMMSYRIIRYPTYHHMISYRIIPYPTYRFIEYRITEYRTVPYRTVPYRTSLASAPPGARRGRSPSPSQTQAS